MNVPRTRRRFTQAFKDDADSLVVDQGDKCAEVARRLGVCENNINTPNSDWTADISYVWTLEGRLHLAVVIAIDRCPKFCNEKLANSASPITE